MTPSSSISLHSIVVRSDTPLSADVGGRVVLMSLEQGKYYDLDAVSSDVWRRLTTPIYVSTLCAALGDSYDAPLETIEGDVVTLLRQLAAQGLIDVQEEQGEDSGATVAS